jgi:hypothetical protein
MENWPRRGMFQQTAERLGREKDALLDSILAQFQRYKEKFDNFSDDGTEGIIVRSNRGAPPEEVDLSV